MARIRFPESNSISFINLDDYDKLQSDETRLYYDTIYQNITNDCYFTKISTDRGLRVQFRTDYSNFTFKIYDYQDNEADLTDIYFISDLYGGETQYNLIVDTSLYTGKYYIIGTFADSDKPTFEWQSQWFDLQDSFENCLLIEWNQGQYGTNNDGIIWDEFNPHIWVDSRISNYVAGGVQSTFRTDNGQLITTKFNPLKSKVWECELMPDIQLEKINIVRGKSFFYINSVQYNSEEVFENERQGDTRLYPLIYQLEMVTNALGYAYEDYTEDLELTGDIPVVPVRVLAINGTQALGISNTKALGIS